uniref:WGS project CBMI000000000 data, contig CS3069_c002561 n=1 Tax=Fusarium clavum TaxID=2594811 RepID=A0A090N5R3_9HYPO|nr:unnamed protein product [Fusarium clavum]
MPSENSSANVDRAQIQELRDALQRLNYQVQGMADHLREALDAIDDLSERVYTLEQQGTPGLAADEASSASSSSSNETSRT